MNLNELTSGMTRQLESKERLTIARLIATTPESRVAVVLKLLEPIIGNVESPEEYCTEAVSDIGVDTEYLIDTIKELASDETAVVKRDIDKVYIRLSSFKEAMTDAGITYREALDALEAMGMLERDSERCRTLATRKDKSVARCVCVKVKS